MDLRRRMNNLANPLHSRNRLHLFMSLMHIFLLKHIRVNARRVHILQIYKLGCQPGMAVSTPVPINQLFNYESIAVQTLFLDVYTWN